MHVEGEVEIPSVKLESAARKKDTMAVGNATNLNPVENWNF